MNKTTYPKDTRSLVRITFVDGEVKDYPCSGSQSLSGHLCRQMCDGAINIYTRETAHIIPAAQVREFELLAYPADVEDEEPPRKAEQEIPF